MRPPFENIFLDVELQQDNFKLIGILIRKGNLLKEIDGSVVGEGLRISTLIKTEEEATFITFNPDGSKGHLEITIKGEKIQNKVSKQLQKNILDFTYNFINFCNSPDVEVVEVYRSDKNKERRIRQNKPILPSSKKIVLTGVTKMYIDKLVNSGEINYSHRFWVRGHFRQYQKHNTRKIWIVPYIKGKGILIEKKYKLKNNRDE